MSANSDDKVGWTYCLTNNLDPQTATIFELLFEQQVDLDEQEIALDLQETSLVLKVAICKALVYPVEALLYRVLVGKEYYNHVKTTKDLYWKFLRKKITLNEFKHGLINLNRRG